MGSFRGCSIGCFRGVLGVYMVVYMVVYTCITGAHSRCMYGYMKVYKGYMHTGYII